MSKPDRCDDIRLRRLAILEGEPAFATPRYVGAPNQPDRDTVLRRVGESLDRNVLSNFGPWNLEFSREIRRQTGVRHALPVANGTVGLELAVRALALSGEVIVPAFTFVATAHAVSWLGLTPVFCDVDPRTHCIDPESVRRLVSPRTSAIIGVHLWGQPCAVEELQAIARSHGLKVIYDAAHAYGSRLGDVAVGNFGDVEVFSFHATKFVNSLEGGAVTTNSEELARTLAQMSNFGFAGTDLVEGIGTNGKLNEISAAFGLSSLEQVERVMEVNRAHHLLYVEGLGQVPGIKVFRHTEETRSNHQYVVIEVDADLAGLTRDQLLTVLHAERVMARRYFYPGCHRMEPYRTLLEGTSPSVPVAERLAESVLCLPTGTRITGEDVAQICAIISQAVAQSEAIREFVQDQSLVKPVPFPYADF